MADLSSHANSRTTISTKAPNASNLFETLKDFVNFPGEGSILVCYHIAFIVCAQGKIYCIVHIVPVGMVLQLFGFECDFSHEAESLGEVFKFESCFKFIVGFFPHNVLY